MKYICGDHVEKTALEKLSGYLCCPLHRDKLLCTRALDFPISLRGHALIVAPGVSEKRLLKAFLSKAQYIIEGGQEEACTFFLKPHPFFPLSTTFCSFSSTLLYHANVPEILWQFLCKTHQKIQDQINKDMFLLTLQELYSNSILHGNFDIQDLKWTSYEGLKILEERITGCLNVKHLASKRVVTLIDIQKSHISIEIRDQGQGIPNRKVVRNDLLPHGRDLIKLCTQNYTIHKDSQRVMFAV